jgi:hypothetical protein
MVWNLGQDTYDNSSLLDAIYEILDVPPPPSDGTCVPSPEDVWIITEDCEIPSDIIAFGSVLIQNNSLVTINSTGSLIIPTGENIIVENNSGLLILSGGKLIIGS